MNPDAAPRIQFILRLVAPQIQFIACLVAHWIKFILCLAVSVNKIHYAPVAHRMQFLLRLVVGGYNSCHALQCHGYSSVSALWCPGYNSCCTLWWADTIHFAPCGVPDTKLPDKAKAIVSRKLRHTTNCILALEGHIQKCVPWAERYGPYFSKYVFGEKKILTIFIFCSPNWISIQYT